MQRNLTMKMIILILTLGFSNIALSQVYQWKDEDGKIHFGDDRRKADSDEVTSLNIKDKYAVPIAEEKMTIANFNQDPTRRLVLNEVILDMPGADTQNILIGRVVCGRPIDLYWTNGVLELERQHVGPDFVKEFEALGYTAGVGEVVREAGELSLTAKIKKIFVNTCTKDKARQISQDSTYVSIEWVVTDPLKNEEVYSFKTRGSHHALKQQAVPNGLSKSFDQSFAMSVKNMLSDQKLVELLKEKVDGEIERVKKDQINISLIYSGGSGSFESRANSLKQRTVIVKTKGGHGSGVFIGKGGYILTNAHVVGNEEKFRIVTDGLDVPAVLVRKNTTRDVAILKLQDGKKSLSPVSIAKNDVELGAELYVIGTPLDMQFSHTVTKGIVSAKRKMRGLNYIQTDAAINFGNSGGPVFDKNGDLIAVAVSSVMNSSGASLNINYLIPIKDALDQLDITTDSVIGGEFFTNPDGSSTAIGSLINSVYYWLNEPVVSF